MLMLCKNCGGQVWREADGRHICFQCARPHDEDGSLIHPVEVGKKMEGKKEGIREVMECLSEEKKTFDLYPKWLQESNKEGGRDDLDDKNSNSGGDTGSDNSSE